MLRRLIILIFHYLIIFGKCTAVTIRISFVNSQIFRIGIAETIRFFSNPSSRIFRIGIAETIRFFSNPSSRIFRIGIAETILFFCNKYSPTQIRISICISFFIWLIITIYCCPLYPITNCCCNSRDTVIDKIFISNGLVETRLARLRIWGGGRTAIFQTVDTILFCWWDSLPYLGVFIGYLCEIPSTVVILYLCFWGITWYVWHYCIGKKSIMKREEYINSQQIFLIRYGRYEKNHRSRIVMIIYSMASNIKLLA